MSFLSPLPSVLVRRFCNCSRHWVIGVDAADSCPAWRGILLSRGQCLCEGLATAAGFESSSGDAADLCSASVISYSAVISACVKGCDVSRSWVSWHCCSILPFCRMSFSHSRISAGEKGQQWQQAWSLWSCCSKLVFCLASFTTQP